MRVATPVCTLCANSVRKSAMASHQNVLNAWEQRNWECPTPISPQNRSHGSPPSARYRSGLCFPVTPRAVNSPFLAIRPPTRENALARTIEIEFSIVGDA